jgi:hypothetical protein
MYRDCKILERAYSRRICLYSSLSLVIREARNGGGMHVSVHLGQEEHTTQYAQKGRSSRPQRAVTS